MNKRFVLPVSSAPRVTAALVAAAMAAAPSLAPSAFAGSAAADGTDFVVTADSGETYTYGSAVGNYTRLVKRGAGEVVLGTASSAFAGSVIVEAGTLTISDRDAVGTSAPIEVLDGATLWLKLANTSSWNQEAGVFTGHMVTICGTGVGGNGALRFTKTSGINPDNLLGGLILSGDATIECATRWGVGRNCVVQLNGHTLTRTGSANSWMIYGRLAGSGTVVNASGKITFQGSPVVDADVTVSTTGGDISLFGTTGSGIAGTIRLSNGRIIEAGYWKAPAQNHLSGPVYAAGTSGDSAYLNADSGKALYLDGPLTGDSGVKIGKTGNSTLSLNGDVNISGNFTVAGGFLNMTNAATRRFPLVAKGDSTVTLGGGTFNCTMLRIANADTKGAALRQTGGTFQMTGTDEPRFAEAAGQRAFFTIEGGETHVSNNVYFAQKAANTFGAFRQTGGLFEMKRPNATDATFFAGVAGACLFVQTGGTNDTLSVRTSQGGGFQMGTNATCEVTVSGEGTLFRTSRFLMGAPGSVCTNILNIGAGAVFKANRFYKSESASAGSRAYVNADGGVIMPTFVSGWGAKGYWDSGFYDRNPDHFVVWGGGLVIDTSENASNSGNTDSTTMALKFEAPTGKGVAAVALPADSAFSATAYMGDGRIVFKDATGWGASAYAEFDFETRALSRIVVTSRGCDYSDGAKAYLESPDRSTRYECAVTLGDNAGMCGELVKRGGPALLLFSANMLTGGIAVESGTLEARAAGVVPSGSPVRVESGATLNLCENGGLSLSTFAGAGLVTNGNVTVATAIRAKCADLFAGRHAVFSGDAAIGAGAVFEITDAENLADYKNAGRVVALAANSVSRQPELRLTKSDGSAYAGDAASWALRLSPDGMSLRFGHIAPTTIIIR